MAPPTNPRAASSKKEELYEETLDMRFHVEKPEDPNIGKIIADRYCINSLVGRGGMGMVYRGEQMNIERVVAIKMLHPHIVADAETIKRFQKEAQAVSRVEHAHSVRIYDFGITPEAQPYLVMDFIDGLSLRHALKKDGPFNLSRAQEIFTQVIDALTCAHSVGVIHRDIKPENIMLCSKSGNDDWVYVVDFGISTLASNEQRAMDSQQGERRGSPPYMSPEQCTKGAEVGAQSDIYSLAIVIFETLSGRLPYNVRNTIEMLEAHVSAQPIPLTAAGPNLVSCEALSHVLQRAMEKSPSRRFQTIEEFGEEFAEAIKRDTIRLNYLKNRKDSLMSSASIPAYKPAGSTTGEHPAVAEDQATSRDGATPYMGTPTFQNLAGVKKDKNLIESVLGVIAGRDTTDEQETLQNSGSKFQFINCPHCNEPVEAGIAFCLACGRSLASTQEFAKVRAAQGVFSLPRSADTLSNSVPVFSAQTRAATGGELTRRVMIAAAVVVAVALIGLAAAKGIIDHKSSEQRQEQAP